MRKSCGYIKSRYGRVSTKRKYNNDDLDNALKDTLQSMANVLPKKIKSKLSSSVPNSNITNVNPFSLGDIVWAKTGKYPVWPGILINEPGTNMVSKSMYRYISIYINLLFFLKYVIIN